MAETDKAIEGTLSEQILTYRYRLLPTRVQHAALSHILEDQRQLYNGALEERIDCYRKTGRTITFFDQTASLTQWRQSDSDARLIPRPIQTWTLKRVDDAYAAFFRRLKARNGKAGFPRFRGKDRWASFGFHQEDGLRFAGRRLRWRGLPGGLRVNLHRALPAGKMLGATFTRNGSGWHVCIQVRVATAALRKIADAVGIDVGLTHLATLSTGETIQNLRPAKRAERELRRRQRAVARCKRGSANRRKARERVARLHRKIGHKRTTYLHQVSAAIVGRFDLIAVEKLNVRAMAGSMLAGPVHDASWARLRQMLAYKAEYAGCELIEVDPRRTSQTCPECGQVAAKPLSQRMHSCDCGCVLGRDHAAALVILSKAVMGLGGGKPAVGSARPRNRHLKGFSA